MKWDLAIDTDGGLGRRAITSGGGYWWFGQVPLIGLMVKRVRCLVIDLSE